MLIGNSGENIRDRCRRAGWPLSRDRKSDGASQRVVLRDVNPNDWSL